MRLLYMLCVSMESKQANTRSNNDSSNIYYKKKLYVSLASSRSVDEYATRDDDEPTGH